MATIATTSTGPAAAAAVQDPTPADAQHKADTPTILTTLHTLLRAHCQAHPSPTLPYLHPYAPLPPAPWKGKARAELPSTEGQLEALRAMRDVVDGARGVLGRRDESDRVRLARAMREVVTHESALLPLGTTLASLPPCSPKLDAVVPLPPAELLSALGKRLGLQVFAEDSQFGLLRTSLTLAGSRFVVDVDLETDAAEGDHTEPPTAAGTPAGSAALGISLTPLTAAFSSNSIPKAKTPSDDRGKVRLAKLTASHVTPAGGAGKSDWIARALRALVEEHLACWNAPTKRGKEGSYAACAALESALAELKALDELAEAATATDADLFLDLETLAGGVEAAIEPGATTRVYVDPKAGIYPSFRLLPSAPGRSNPAFRFRPSGKGESVPPPPSSDEDANAMAVDTLDPMCRGAWLLELVDDNTSPSAGGRGLVVRRIWLQPEAPENEAAASLATGIKAEGLLYQAAMEEQAPPALPLFPYASVFANKRKEGMGQYWSLAAPGPDGYIVGRVGLPASWAEFGRLATALRAQLVLNALFSSAFDPAVADKEAEANTNGDAMAVDGARADEEGDVMDLAELESAPTSLPLTASLHARSFRIAFPFPNDAAEPPTVTLELRPDVEAPYVAGSWDAEPVLDDAARERVDAAVKAALDGSGGVDAVEVIARVLAAL